ncbi:hypothetical protein ABEB36_004700 [Hypothenemus hampei]|uniref:Uncharacterized protein n=1 Tax=Hypothenemus hampei TaxID=57062 RepID=A0ABD1F458_HYPHA
MCQSMAVGLSEVGLMEVSKMNITKVISGLRSNAVGADGIAVRMLKCDTVLYRGFYAHCDEQRAR